MDSSVLEVSVSEAGQKLLQFLARRLGIARSALHRWIRTGRVRRNGLRATAFERLDAGDRVRIPPFSPRPRPPSAPGGPPLPEIVARTHDMLVVHKPAGLPVHPGSGHADSLSARLAAHFPERPFAPTPAHRLDKDSSGLLLVALSYARLRALHEAFAARAVTKEYLSWVEGAWPHEEPRTLRDLLARAGGPGKEKTRARREGEQGREAVCEVRCLRREKAGSLVHVRLITGRTHQIRAQLSLRGHPVCGDVKYGARRRAGGLLLHSFRVTLPGGERFTLPPPWTGEWRADPECLEPCIA
jgi:23S rRNA pseudouridine955/2504/2580 synthase